MVQSVWDMSMSQSIVYIDSGFAMYDNVSPCGMLAGLTITSSQAYSSYLTYNITQDMQESLSSVSVWVSFLEKYLILDVTYVL